VSVAASGGASGGAAGSASDSAAGGSGGRAIELEVDDGVGMVWLNRPAARNAFTRPMQVELHAALADLDARADVRAIVVAGRGRYFSTGTELRSDGSTFAMDAEQMAEECQVLLDRPRPWRMSTPVIAAMHGPAVGLGLTLALQWDIRIMAADALYGFVFVRRGLTPEAHSLWLLQRLVGLSRAAELLLTGRLFDGAEAERIGLATRAVPSGDVLDAAMAIARDIADHAAPRAVALTKRMLYDFAEQPEREVAYWREWMTFRELGNEADAREGVDAFLERRPAQWKPGKA
jgi:enoyl-CoA hydratase/carnithine racemase